MQVNSTISEPRSPGPWVDDTECSCGQKYYTFRCGVTFRDGADLVRMMNKPDGGYRSRGPVLWAMRTIKLAHWYAAHMFCSSHQ